MNSIPCCLRSFLFLTATFFTAGFALAQTESWTGGGTNQNWSTPANWSAGIVPNSPTNVIFTNNVGAASAQGVVDSIVDSGFSGAIATLQFNNTNNNTAGFYHTLQIGSGQTLTVLSNLTVGGLQNTNSVYAGFTGGGTLVVSNLAAGVNVSEGDANNISLAILNMTNLNTFAATIGGITVGVYNTPNPSIARQKGYLYLAETNVINVIGNAPHAYGNEGQIEIGENLGNGSNIQVPMYLGIMNTIAVNTITVGGDKQGSGALLAFNPVFTNDAAVAIICGTNGPASRVTTWKVADNSNQTTTGSGCVGTVDLSNGLLDALVNNLIIGESESGASSGTGNGTGTFTFNAGTNNVNNLYLGYRIGTGPNSDPAGTLNVNGTGTLVVNNAICFAFTNGGALVNTASGTLNVNNNGTVLANTITNAVPGGSGVVANINVTGGTLGVTSLAGVVGTLAAPIINLSLNNASLQLEVSGAQTNIATETLTLAGATNVVNFTYLPPVNSYPTTNAILWAANGVSAPLNLGISNFPAASPAYQGYLTNDNNTIYLVLTAGPLIGSSVDVWTGQNGDNWDLSTLNWSSFGSPVTFASGAPVQFDDTASGSTVNLTTSLLPAIVTVSNNVLNYAFGGSGAIGGAGGLTKDGAGTLLITNTGVNNFLGAVTVNAGTAQFGSGGTAGNLPATGTVSDNGTLALDWSGNVTVPNTLSGAGTFIKGGGSVLTLVASNSFSGIAAVANGTLLVNGVLSGTLTNAAGAVIGGSGTNAGPVVLGGMLQPSAATGVPVTFTAGSLTLAAGGSLAFDLSGSANGANDLIDVNGNLDVNNDNVIALNFQNVPQTGTPYTLINFTGNQNGTFNPIIGGTHFAATLSQGSSPVTVTLNGTGANLTWDSLTNNAWNIGTGSNWLNTGTSQQDVFYQGDNVRFDDSVPGEATAITIPTGVDVSPMIVTVNSATNNYAIAGPGQITGNVNIIKEGASTLTLSSANLNFTGTATVQGGILRAGSGNAFGTAGTVVATNGGSFDFAGQGIGEVPVIISGAGANGNGAIINSGADQIHAVNIVELSGDATFGGSGRWDIRVNGSDNASLTTTDGQSHNLIKTGSNLVALVTCTIDPSIGNIDIQGGTLGLQLAGTSQNSGGWFGDTSHTISVETNATLEFNTLSSAYPLYRTIALYGGSTVMSDAGDNGIGGSVILSGNDTFDSGGSSPWLVVSGVISGSGNLVVKGTEPLTLSANNTYTGSTLINGGTLLLIGNGSISASSDIIIAAGTALDVSQSSSQVMTLAAGQTLQGNGTVYGGLVVGAGATVSAGTNFSATGSLSVTNGVTLQGNTLMKLNPGNSTSDQINATDATGIILGGTLTLTNVSGSSYAIGNTFTLFTAAGLTNSFTAIVPATPGPGLAWNTNNLANGVLSIVAGATVPPPGITGITISGGSLIITGTNGVANEQYNVMTTTNLALPLAEWTVLPAGMFSSANFSITNPVNANAPQSYYMLEVP